jgi:hypothetical protein
VETGDKGHCSLSPSAYNLVAFTALRRTVAEHNPVAKWKRPCKEPGLHRRMWLCRLLGCRLCLEENSGGPIPPIWIGTAH